MKINILLSIRRYGQKSTKYGIQIESPKFPLDEKEGMNKVEFIIRELKAVLVDQLIKGRDGEASKLFVSLGPDKLEGNG